MEEKKTVQYKRTLRGSLGAGVNALFNGNGRRFYILEHRDASKYHKAGESQKIIIDQIELGRLQSCQVRYDDETWDIVSRRHAAIIREGDRWKLVQLSSTNSTFLNGRKIETEWYLENGDEIQLAVNGPRLGFIVPSGKQSLVSSIKMTERLELFRKQALRPYKQAIAAIFTALIIIAGGATWAYLRMDDNIDNILTNAKNQEKIFEQFQKKYVEDSIKMAEKKPDVIVVNPEKDLVNAIAALRSSVFAIQTSVYLESDDERQLVEKIQGTGFLLDDGRFVTARHCVEPWFFNLDKLQVAFALANSSNGKLRVYAEIKAMNNEGKLITFKSNDFIMDRSRDEDIDVPYELHNEEIILKGRIAFNSVSSLGDDWAYSSSQSEKGYFKDGRTRSTVLKAGTTVHVLGFPRGLGIGDGNTVVDPIYNKLSVARDGLNDARCIMINQGIDNGNSGGPVFMLDGKNPYVVGIVSRGDVHSDIYNHLVPMSNLK